MNRIKQLKGKSEVDDMTIEVMKATAEDYRRKAKFIKVQMDMGVEVMRDRVK